MFRNLRNPAETYNFLFTVNENLTYQLYDLIVSDYLFFRLFSFSFALLECFFVKLSLRLDYISDNFPPLLYSFYPVIMFIFIDLNCGFYCSGQSAGPLSMKLPLAVKGSVSTKKYIVLSEKLHNCDNVEDQSIENICSFGDSILPHSCLLDEVI